MLSGSLDAFALPDVFALLAMTHKTGVLQISAGRTEGRVDFRDGEIAYAVSDARRMALASRLLGGGLVNEEQLRHVVAAQRGGAAALTRALLDDGVLDPETFDHFVREQIQDAVFELMRISDGTFSFQTETRDEPDEADGAAIRLRVTTDQLVTEGARRLREWADITSRVVSFSAVVTLAPQPVSGSDPVSMEPEQWRLLTFVDGRRTVRDLVDLTGQGEYATCQVIAGLVAAGLVEVVDPAAGGRTRVSQLVARHDLLRRLEERELGGARAAETAVPGGPEPGARVPAAASPGPGRAAPDSREAVDEDAAPLARSTPDGVEESADHRPPAEPVAVLASQPAAPRESAGRPEPGWDPERQDLPDPAEPDILPPAASAEAGGRDGSVASEAVAGPPPPPIVVEPPVPADPVPVAAAAPVAAVPEAEAPLADPAGEPVRVVEPGRDGAPDAGPRDGAPEPGPRVVAAEAAAAARVVRRVVADDPEAPWRREQPVPVPEGPGRVERERAAVVVDAEGVAEPQLDQRSGAQERPRPEAPVPSVPVIGYRPDEPRPRGARGETGSRRNRADEDAFDRAEVERELAALGFRDAVRGGGAEDEDPAADEDLPPSPFRANRADDPNRGLLHRLIDVRKQP